MTASWDLHRMDCRSAMSMLMAPDSVDAIVTDPPYGLSREPDAAEVLRHWLNGDDYAHTGSGFMGKSWDSFVPGPSVWREAYRVLKPGGYLLAFFGTRTYDLGVMAIRLAGFEVRDELCWLYGSGFPKSLDVSKAIDKAAGAEREITHTINRTGKTAGTYGAFAGPSPASDPATDAARQWQGWGTALKPAHEPIVLARKPLAKGGTVAQNVLTHGTGGLHIDACRVGIETAERSIIDNRSGAGFGTGNTVGAHQGRSEGTFTSHDAGRFPPNVLHDGSDEVLACFPDAGGGYGTRGAGPTNGRSSYALGGQGQTVGFGDSGSAARFFPSCQLDEDDVATQRVLYCAKASRLDRNEGCEAFPERAAFDNTNGQMGGNMGSLSKPRANHHPTVKPTPLMRWLVRLVTPPGGTVLDPFAGSGSTGKAALLEGFSFVGCEMTDEYADIAEARLRAACPLADPPA